MTSRPNGTTKPRWKKLDTAASSTKNGNNKKQPKPITMTPMQTMISKIDNVICSSTEPSDQLLIVRAMAELLLTQEQKFIEDTYYQGRRDQVFKETDLVDYMDKLNQQPW